MMKYLSCLAIVLLLSSGLDATAVNFYDGDVVKARQKANAEGKLFFVDFYAKWCMPCKWMDQTTFADPTVAQLMNDELVSVKVNIDDLDGFSLSQKYDIQVLPTILIFNSEGQMIDRIEETMTPTKMLATLRQHLGSDNTPMQRSVNRSPRRSDTAVEKVDEPTQSTYRLQMGAYTDYTAAATKVKQLQNTFLEPIVVINDVKDDQVIFKIMMGHFSTKEEALDFQKILRKDFHLDSFVP